MRAIAYKEIDGFHIVVGEAIPALNPEATIRIAKHTVLSAPSVRDRLSLLQAPHTEGADSFAREVVDQVKKYAEENPVYFEHVPGQKLLPDSQVKNLLSQEAPEGFLLDVDGCLVPDLRGRVYWVHEGTWRSVAIREIGELPPPEALFTEELSESQKKQIRLERPQKIQQMERMKREFHAKKDAEEIRRRMELTEDPEHALALARRILKQDLAKIAEDYQNDTE